MTNLSFASFSEAMSLPGLLQWVWCLQQKGYHQPHISLATPLFSFPSNYTLHYCSLQATGLFIMTNDRYLFMMDLRCQFSSRSNSSKMLLLFIWSLLMWHEILYLQIDLSKLLLHFSLQHGNYGRKKKNEADDLEMWIPGTEYFINRKAANMELPKQLHKKDTEKNIITKQLLQLGYIKRKHNKGKIIRWGKV